MFVILPSLPSISKEKLAKNLHIRLPVFHYIQHWGTDNLKGADRDWHPFCPQGPFWCSVEKKRANTEDELGVDDAQKLNAKY